jgi:hypothetical protein
MEIADRFLAKYCKITQANGRLQYALVTGIDHSGITGETPQNRLVYILLEDVRAIVELTDEEITKFKEIEAKAR